MKVTLSDPEYQQLVEAMKTTPDARLRVRCQAVLMAARRRPHGHIAEDLAVSVRTLQRWLSRYHQQGLVGSRSAGLRGERRRFQRPWHPKSWAGFDRGQPAAAWTGLTGPMKS
jgi:hypothetical protein